MDALERQARLTAGLEALGEIRAAAVAGQPFDVGRFKAAVTVLATALDDQDRAVLMDTLPAGKASLTGHDLDDLTMFVADRLMAGLPPGKGATKAMAWLLPDVRNEHDLAADSLRWIIADEDRSRKAALEAAQKAEDDRWVQTWLEHGRRRTKLVRLLATATAR